MSVEEDIGGLKADMETVKGQTSNIFTTVNGMAVALADYMATTTARQDRTDEHVEELKTEQDEVSVKVDAIVNEQKKMRGTLAKVSSVAGVIGAAIGAATVKSVDTFFR